MYVCVCVRVCGCEDWLEWGVGVVNIEGCFGVAFGEQVEVKV